MSNSLPQGWEEKELGKIAEYVTKKIEVNKITLENYISTENMSSNIGGVEKASSLPKVNKVNAYQREDILFSNIRTYFKKIWFATFDGGSSTDVLTIRKKEKEFCSKYLYYSLTTENYFDYTVKTSKGTKMPRGDKNAIMQYKIKFPKDINEQKRIADILSAFDDKIELNSQINKTLEDMATALFKEWFENFNFPNDEGKAYKENGGEMKPSELGEIPIDWNVLNLSKITSKIGDGLHGTPNYSEDGEYFFINGNNLVNGVVEIDKKTKRASFQEFEKYKKKLDNNTIFLSINGTLGNIAFYKKEKIFLSKSVCYINPIDEYYKFFIACLFKSSYFKQYLFNYSNGTTIKNLSLKAIRELSFSINEGICKKFSNIIKPIFEQIQQNQQQNQILKKQRDTLLPKLMSGKIRV